MVDHTGITNAIVELKEEEVFKKLNNFMIRNPSSQEVYEVVEACQEGMAKIGELYDEGEYFVGDLIFAGEIMKESIEILKHKVQPGCKIKSGKILLGTVQGDLHDIGKNIFGNMAEAAGFEVLDLGRDQLVETFVRAVASSHPEFIGMGGLLSSSLDSMKNIVDSLKKAGLRDSVKVLIGGWPVTKEACEYIAADAFAKNAVEGVKILQSWNRAMEVEQRFRNIV